MKNVLKLHRAAIALCMFVAFGVATAQTEEVTSEVVGGAESVSTPEPTGMTEEQVRAIAAELIAAQAAKTDEQFRELGRSLGDALTAKTEELINQKTAEMSKKGGAGADESDSKNFIGFRGAFGVSNFSGHKAILTNEFTNYGIQASYAIQLGAGAFAQGGLTYRHEFTDLIALAVECNFGAYTARGGFSLKDNGVDFGKMTEAKLTVHSLEFPILARFSFLKNRMYAEIGPQFGADIYGKIDANSEMKKPDLKGFAFGPAGGLGYKAGNKAVVGVRAYYNVVEYAKNSGGNQWTVNLGMTFYPIAF